MSAAIKRLSTIIRPHPHTQTSSASPQKESSKSESNPVGSAAPPDPENNFEQNASSAPATTTMSTTEIPADSSAATATAPAVDPTIAPSLAPEHPPTQDEAQAATATASTAADAPATTEAAQEPPVLTDPATTEDKADAQPAAKKSDAKHETTSVKERSRRPRDIGRDTIRRFSSILRPGNGSHPKEKDAVPPVPAPAPKAKDEETTEAAGAIPAVDTETSADAATTQPEPTPAPAVVEQQEKLQDSKSAKPAKPVKSASAVSKTKEKEKDKSEKTKVANRRGSSFFSAARDVVRGPRRETTKSKPTTAKTESVTAKVTKKGAAKGKRVVVITGASRGSGLELVKQYAVQPDTFVIALSRSVDKVAEIRTIVNESAKSGHNVRPVRVDIGNAKSVASAVKEIVELTDGRIDLLIHAAGTENESPLRIGEIKGPELEEELRYNLIGPISLTNALLAHLKPFPPPPPPAVAEVKETEEAKHVVAPAETTEAERTEELKKDTKAEVMEGNKPEADTNKETPALPEPKDGEAAVAAQDTTSTAPAEAEEIPVPAAEPTIEPNTEAAPAAVASAVEPIATVGEAKQTETEPIAVAAAVPLPADPTPAPASALVEEIPSTPPVPIYFPSNPFVIFLAPSDPIFNNQGSVPAGSFVPSPRTLFSLSRSALQVAIAKYAMSLGGQTVGVVGIERPGVLDPHSTITDAQAVKSVMEYLPSVTLNKSGKLLRV